MCNFNFEVCSVCIVFSIRRGFNSDFGFKMYSGCILWKQDGLGGKSFDFSLKSLVESIFFQLSLTVKLSNFMKNIRKNPKTFGLSCSDFLSGPLKTTLGCWPLTVRAQFMSGSLTRKTPLRMRLGWHSTSTSRRARDQLKIALHGTRL